MANIFIVKPIALGYFDLPGEKKKRKHQRHKRKNSFKRMKTPYKTPSPFTSRSMFSMKTAEKIWNVEKKIGKGAFFLGGKAFQGAKVGAGYIARKLPVGIKQKLPGKHEGIRSIASEVKEQKGNKQPIISYGKREGRKE